MPGALITVASTGGAAERSEALPQVGGHGHVVADAGNRSCCLVRRASSATVAVDPAGFCKLKCLIQSSDGRTVYPGMEAFLTGTPSKAQLDDHAADIASAWSGGFAGYMSDHWTFTGLRLLYSDGTAVIEGDATASTTGSIPSAGPAARRGPG